VGAEKDTKVNKDSRNGGLMGPGQALEKKDDPATILGYERDENGSQVRGEYLMGV